MISILEDLRTDLRAKADEAVRISGEGFFKEGVKLYGIRNALVHTMSKEFYKKLPDKSKPVIFALCKELWMSGYNEEAFVACNWSYAVRKQFTPEDMATFEKWVDKYVTNWATCDTFCNHTVGELVEKFPECLTVLKKWALSPNRWMKRGSAVSLIIPARKGKFLTDIFEIAGILLTDSDDMVQKGYGWMLKAASESYQKEVYDFVTGNSKLMPRTAFRYAIEKMPAELRAKAMMK
jgi:3-methyladenine DNA glycosylase AlkD